MATCEKCHRKFGSYSALEQHYDKVHPTARRPAALKDKVIAEVEANVRYKSSMHARRSSGIKVAVFVLVVIVAVSVTGYVAFAPKEQVAGRSVGTIAPDFSLPDIKGGTFRLYDYRGKSNVLIFYNEGLSCQPCLQQAHDLDQLNEQFVELNVVVVSIMPNSLNQLIEWASSGGPRYGKVLSDENHVMVNLYGVPSGAGMQHTMPHTFILIDKAGVVQWWGDYSQQTMYVPNDQIIAAVRRALGA
jgi:peroxiredoxin Q/BCP